MGAATMTQKRSMHLIVPPPATPIAPPTKGRLWYDFQIPDEFFEGLPGITNKVRWVREHLPRETRKKIGRASAWYDADIRDAIAKGLVRRAAS